MASELGYTVPHTGYAHSRPVAWWKLLGMIGRAVDIADEACERGDIDADDIDQYARVVVGRIFTMAQRSPRALHTWFHNDETRGETDRMQSAPDGYDRVKSASKTTRSNSGHNVTTVFTHGRSYVGGDMTAQPSSMATMSAAHVEHALATAPRTANGMVDGVALNRLTRVIYPDLPELMGTDTVEWEERQVDVQSHRPLAMPTRYRLVNGKGRLSTSEQRESHELIAPTDDDAFVFVGHRRALRAQTYRETRAANRRGIDDSFALPFDVPLADAITGIASTLDVGARVAWSHREHNGWLNVSKTGRYSMTTTMGKIDPQRTLRGLRNATERLTDQ